MTTPQVLMLMSLRSKGWPAELRGHLLTRCSAIKAEYLDLVAAGYLEEAAGRIILTTPGKRALRAEKATNKHWV